MVVKHPLLSEKAVNLIEKENTLVFVVEKQATKQQIKKAVEELYDVKVTGVRTSINMRGQKRAFVKLEGKKAAMDLATKLNIM
jgi:large subunit ribosomal protein L23